MPFFTEGDPDPRQQPPPDSNFDSSGAPPPAASLPVSPVSASPPPATPSTFDIINAEFRRSNSVVSTLSAITEQPHIGEPDPNWNPRSYNRGTKYEQRYGDRFLGDFNKNETDWRRAQIDKEENDDRIRQAGGWTGTMSGLAAGLVDWPTAIPIFGELGLLKGIGGRAASAFEHAAGLGLSGAVQSGAQELALQGSQQTRSWGESAGNVASSAILMGILGGAIGTLARPEQRVAAQALDQTRPKVALDETGKQTIVSPSAPERTSGYTLAPSPVSEPESNKLVYRILGPDGRKVGNIYGAVEGSDFRVQLIEGGGANNLGPRVIRDIQRQLTELHPEVSTISGNRTSGARRETGAPGEAKIAVNPLEDAPASVNRQTGDVHIDESHLFQQTERPAPEPTPEVAAASAIEEPPQVKRPPTLLDWLKSNGGVKDEGGELTARGLVRGYPGLVNNKSGMSLDMARRQAAQAGYLGADIDHAMSGTAVNDLLDHIDQHPTFSHFDEEQRLAHEQGQQIQELKAQYADAAQQINDLTTELGHPPINKELLHEASALMVHERLPIDDALEQAALRSLDDESRAIVRKAIPDHEIPDLDASSQRAHSGGATGERPGAQGQARAERIEPSRGVSSAGNTGTGAVARSVGAAAADARDLVPIGFGLNKLGIVSDKVLNRLSPNLRVFVASQSVQAKRSMADLVETAIRFTQHAQGIPTSLKGPIESLVRVERNQYQAAYHDILESAWKDHRWGEGVPVSKGQRAGAAISDVSGRTPEGKLSYARFKEAVSDAMNHGDVHDIPEVQKAAEGIRSQVLDPIKERAQSIRDLDGQPMLGKELEPPRGAESFFPHLWDKEQVRRRWAELRGRFADWLGEEQAAKADLQDRVRAARRNLDASEEKIAKLQKSAEKLPENDKARADIEYDIRLEEARQGDLRKAIEEQIQNWEGKASRAAKRAIEGRAEKGVAGEGSRSTGADKEVDAAVRRILGSTQDLTREELESRADEWLSRIVSSPDGRIPYDMHSANPAGGYGGKGGDLRGSLNARETAIPYDRIKDFLHRDTEMVLGAHLRTILPDMHLTERFGDANLTEPMRKIQEEYAAKITGDTGEKQSAKLIAQRDSDIKDIAAMRDRLRGVFGWTPGGALDKITRNIHNWTTIQSLGTSVINRFNDAGAQAVFRYGFMHTFSDLWVPLFKAMAFNPEVLKIGKGEAREMGIGIDGMLGHMRHNLTDIAEMHTPGDKFSKGLAWGADRSMIVNMHGPWTDWIKGANWIAAQSHLGQVAKRIAESGGTERDLMAMADANIDRGMMARISAMYEKHATDVGGVRMAHAGAWEDQAARDAFAQALSREVNINVITAGHGDRPLIMSKPMGALIGQFKGFTAGTHEKILISNIQQRDGRTLQGLLTSVGMGMISYRLYTLASGQQASPRPQDWIKEGIHRSAITGWFTEANNTLARFTSGKLDYNRLYGADRPLSRRAEESALADMLGPAYSQAEGVTGVIGHVFGGHASAQDIHNLRKMFVPMQNLMGFRALLDNVEDGVSRSLGMKPREHTPSQTWNQAPPQ